MEDRLVKAPPKASAKASQGVVPGASAHHDLPLFIDGWTTGGGHHGIVNITLGTLIYGTDGTATPAYAVSLRMTPATARILAANLTEFARQAEAPVQSRPPTDTKLN